MSDYVLECAYRAAYWRHNEFQIIRADFDNKYIRAEIRKLAGFMTKIVNRLGYCPEA